MRVPSFLLLVTTILPILLTSTTGVADNYDRETLLNKTKEAMIDDVGRACSYCYDCPCNGCGECEFCWGCGTRYDCNKGLCDIFSCCQPGHSPSSTPSPSRHHSPTHTPTPTHTYTHTQSPHHSVSHSPSRSREPERECSQVITESRGSGPAINQTIVLGGFSTSVERLVLGFRVSIHAAGPFCDARDSTLRYVLYTRNRFGHEVEYATSQQLFPMLSEGVRVIPYSPFEDNRFHLRIEILDPVNCTLYYSVQLTSAEVVCYPHLVPFHAPLHQAQPVPPFSAAEYGLCDMRVCSETGRAPSTGSYSIPLPRLRDCIREHLVIGYSLAISMPPSCDSRRTLIQYSLFVYQASPYPYVYTLLGAGLLRGDGCDEFNEKVVMEREHYRGGETVHLALAFIDPPVCNQTMRYLVELVSSERC